MPRKVYTEQFKRDAVAMFESNPDTSMRKVAEELGINRSTLGCWYKQFGTNVAKDEDAASPVEKLADAERIRQLERENKGFVKSAIFCVRPRSILRKRRPGDPLPVR